jgi:hypothetical protein
MAYLFSYVILVTTNKDYCPVAVQILRELVLPFFYRSSSFSSSLGFVVLKFCIYFIGRHSGCILKKTFLWMLPHLFRFNILFFCLVHSLWACSVPCIFFFHWHCSPLWALAYRTRSFHFFLSVTNSLHHH